MKCILCLSTLPIEITIDVHWNITIFKMQSNELNFFYKQNVDLKLNLYADSIILTLFLNGTPLLNITYNCSYSLVRWGRRLRKHVVIAGRRGRG